MWDAIREFLGAVVSFFYGLIPNLGVAIILLTVAVGVVLFPLTLKQTRSMRAMQQLAPELKRLQKEFAGDKPALQQATLALYKERGVNPAAGCLPLLLQMPIWFALFQVLQSFSASPLSLNDTCSGQSPGITAGTAYTCYFEGFVPGGETGQVNTVTARVRDSLEREENRVDSATVGVGDAFPLVTVALRPDSGVVPQGGGAVRFEVEVVNGGADAVTVEGLRAASFGDLLAPVNEAVTDSTCAAADRVIPGGGLFSCSFQATVPGGTAAFQSTLTADLRDGADRQASRVDGAAVGLGDVMPLVTVSIRPEAGVVPESGGLVRFKVEVVNDGAETVNLVGLADDRFGNLTSPGGNPTRFLALVPNGDLYNDIQDWLEAGRQPADPAWRAFAGMNLSITPRDAFGLGFVAFIPYLVTLLLVMGTAFYQQKQTTPKPKDGQSAPQQPGQAILKIFPVFFGFISYTLPAGLAVYFAASSLFRIAQQDLIIRLGDRHSEGRAKSESVAEPTEPEVKPSERPGRPSGSENKPTGA
ncbi:MAG: membrane protein insertase YidC, partial [Acidimicrobiia bacterium]|nr:membrane protein insertase YidC [Acidimicrobiia bacterium]